MQPKPWQAMPVEHHYFEQAPREYGILPFWFLNGELDPKEMLYQLKELRSKGMPGVILHARYGLETPYLSPAYLERIRFAIEESEKLGLKTWIYDEMNWPSGTADKQVIRVRPDLVQRYLECIHFTTRGPWFTYLTGADSRYNDFERSTPVAAFAIGSDGKIIDLTPNLSFRDVIPWEAPAGNWRILYIVEKTADYYIDALNPESTAEFLRLGYEPYIPAVGEKISSEMLGFYTDEPAMHYYLTGGDNPIIPWTKDMFRSFGERNGYSLRPRLPDLFFDITPDSARVRFDFYNTLTDLYSSAFYQQIHEWCQAHNVLFTGHLLYEEWLRRLIRVEGNPFKHYPHMDVIGIDHLYPVVGSRDRPDEHVAIKLGSSAAHHLGSPRLLCESFGGIFMDTTMQRMKWIADWEYVLGVNLLNPHGFHYTLEGPRKRDWPPSMFYQYPWWCYYSDFSKYISRLGYLLSGGRHVAKVAVLWPIHSAFATYTPQNRNTLGDRTEFDFNALTDLLLRLHYDFDYIDEDILRTADLTDNTLRVGEEVYELVILPPLTHIKLSALEKLEQFSRQNGRILGTIFLPASAFESSDGYTKLVDISNRILALFGQDPIETQQNYKNYTGIEIFNHQTPEGGKNCFIRSFALARQLPFRLRQQIDDSGRGACGQAENPYFVVETENEQSSYFYAPPHADRQDISEEVVAERKALEHSFKQAIEGLISPDVTIDNSEIFYLHRVKDGRDIYFLVNPTFTPQKAQVALTGEEQPLIWDPSTGKEKVIAPWQIQEGRIYFSIALPPAGSAFILTQPQSKYRIINTNLVMEEISDVRASGYGVENKGHIAVQQNGSIHSLLIEAADDPQGEIRLDGEWEFTVEGENALVIGKWAAVSETPGTDWHAYAAPHSAVTGWLPMVPGVWSYQLPTEPDRPYPIYVWYRVHFKTKTIPPKLNLIADGFAGSEYWIYLNGEAVTATPVRSSIDSQMKAVDITGNAQLGENILAIRLTVTNPTDGLLDLIKITGDFSLEEQEDDLQIVRPRRKLQPAPWTSQGYPFYSGRASYCFHFELPSGLVKSLDSQKVFLEPVMNDDALEVLVNGQPAGVRLWEPYSFDITGLLRPGKNSLEMRVANTLVNLLEAVKRPSGLAGAPKMVFYRRFTFDLTKLK